MRQAGRYLPEFREIRAKNKDFIKLCLNSELSSQITLQPIKRFDLDSAIVFSDILMVPYALGQKIDFSKEHGPTTSVFNLERFLSISEEEFTERLNPVYKTINLTRKKLDKKKALICFVGAPWTLITYMLNIDKGKAEEINKIYKHPNIDKIFSKLTHFLNIHIDNQINAGANVAQIFDSWAGLLPAGEIDKFCFKPNASIIEFCRNKKIPNICFPKGINRNYERFIKIVRPDGINIDYEINPDWIKTKLNNTVVQGGPDPRALLKPDPDMFKVATKYLKAFKDIPYVFNLGHGLLPGTNPDKVKKLINFYRGY